LFQHALDNKYNHVPLADPICGILDAMPVHAFCKGMIEVVTFLVLDTIPKRQKAPLHRLAVRFSQIPLSVKSQGLPCNGLKEWDYQFDLDFGCRLFWSIFLFLILAQYNERQVT
jgi:hypothetical protein